MRERKISTDIFFLCHFLSTYHRTLLSTIAFEKKIIIFFRPTLINKSPSANNQDPVLKNYFCNKQPLSGITPSDSDNQELWYNKLEVIRVFQRERKDQGISEGQAEHLIEIYNRYKHIFSNTPGKVKDYQCEIKFKEPVDFHRKSYPIAYSLKDEVRAEINRMMEDDIIEYSQSPYTSPIVAIPKKNGKVRICLDAREINKRIINDRTSPGEIEEILKKFHGTKYISTWDTVCGYWQMELHHHSRQYMVFIFNRRNYQFKRLPFGLINSVAVFVKCMDQVLGQETLQFTTVYMDDLLIISSNWNEHCI